MYSCHPNPMNLRKQTELGSHREVRLKKLSDTRWACRYASIKVVTTTFTAVLATLEEISEGGDQDRIVEARGILLQVRSFQFVLCLVLFSKLSDVLQAERMNFAGAVSCIEATVQTLQDMWT